MTNVPSEDILKQVALMVADIADALAPLVANTQPHLGQFGGVIPRPAPIEIANALRIRADGLRLLYSTDSNVQEGSK